MASNEQHTDDYHRGLFAASAPRGRHEAPEVETEPADDATGDDGDKTLDQKVVTPPPAATPSTTTTGVETK